MKQARLNRLFGTSGNCFDVAIDHGMFNERTFLAGIENMRKAIEVIAAAGPDAIQLPPGTAPMLQSIPGKARPALVLRTDIANIYGNPLPSALFSEVIDRPVEIVSDNQMIPLLSAFITASVRFFVWSF